MYDLVDTENLISEGIWLYTLTNRGSTLQNQAFSATFVEEISGVHPDSSIANVKPGIVGSVSDHSPCGKCGMLANTMALIASDYRQIR